jgi:hypothetical protein
MNDHDYALFIDAMPLQLIGVPRGRERRAPDRGGSPGRVAGMNHTAMNDGDREQRCSCATIAGVHVFAAHVGGRCPRCGPEYGTRDQRCEHL